jgi:hypothetical protein
MQRKSGAPKGKEIELTPAMIEAGLKALWATGAIEHPSGGDESVVRAVFSAMIAVSPLSLRGSKASS